MGPCWAKLGPLTVVIWDADVLAEEVRESSLEAGLVLKLHDHFPWKCQNEDEVVILTAYKKHAKLLLQHIAKKNKVYGIDATQGIEKDSGIFSCGRHDGGTGFLKDIRRMCVGFSRLRNEMILVAHASLVRPTSSSRPSPLWAQMYKVW